MFGKLFTATDSEGTSGAVSVGAVSGVAASVGISESLMEVANMALSQETSDREREAQEREPRKRDERFKAATTYMAQHDCDGIEFVVFAALLKNDHVLSTFEAKDDYESKRSHLVKLWVSSTCSILLICSISQAPAPLT